MTAFAAIAFESEVSDRLLPDLDINSRNLDCPALHFAGTSGKF